MGHIVRTIAAIRYAWSTRRDLLSEALALRRQLAVLARSNRRFRSADRLLWLILRRVWPRWRDALMLVQPATVDRWYRDGFFRWWPRRTRRPGRPRIHAECRQMIQQIAAENRLWGAPRIHGELVKLGIAVSERTVSRYLRERPRGSSQTWRTFVANHCDQLTFISAGSAAPRADDVANGDGLTCRHTPSFPYAPYRSYQRTVVACDASPQLTSPATHLVHDHFQRPPHSDQQRPKSTDNWTVARPIHGDSKSMASSGADLRVTTLYCSSGPSGLRSHHIMNVLTRRHSGCRLHVRDSHTGRNIGQPHPVVPACRRRARQERRWHAGSDRASLHLERRLSWSPVHGQFPEPPMVSCPADHGCRKCALSSFQQ